MSSSSESWKGSSVLSEVSESSEESGSTLADELAWSVEKGSSMEQAIEKWAAAVKKTTQSKGRKNRGAMGNHIVRGQK